MIPILFVFSDIGITILRVALALILILHGWPKFRNMRQTGENFTAMGFKPGRFWGPLVACVEFVGGLFLCVGLFTQVIVAVIAVQFLVVIFKVKLKSGFVGGYEFDLLILAAALALTTLGGGALGVDSLFRILIY